MLDYGSALERSRRLFTRVEKLEHALAHQPADRALQMDLQSLRRLAHRSQEELFSLAESAHVDICRYKVQAHEGAACAVPITEAKVE